MKESRPYDFEANSPQNLVPQENLEIYILLYQIEVGLREFIIDMLQALDGPRWYKKRLPGDILEKYRNGRNIEKQIKWVELIPHHPIYYIDFTDLRKIIERKDNWVDAFEKILGPKKEIVVSILSELDHIRNKIAHNRKATTDEAANTKVIYRKLEKLIGDESFNKFVSRCTYRTDIPNQLIALQKECEETFKICKGCQSLKAMAKWNSVFNEWWFDESYLGSELNCIIDYFTTIEQYIALPRTRGSGYKIEEWTRAKELESKYRRVAIEFSSLLKSWRT